jgi:tetratricopeptide (TPR) repeat protein
MPFWQNIKATIYSTRGYRNFISGKYDKAISLFEKAISLDSDADIKKLSHSYLGRAYANLGRYEDAVSIMPKADELYDLEDNDKDEYTRKEYKAFLHAYSLSLQKLGLDEKAEIIRNKANR